MIYREKKYMLLAAISVVLMVLLLILNFVISFDLRLQTIANATPYKSLDVIIYNNGELEVRRYNFGKNYGLFTFIPKRGDNIELKSLVVNSNKINSGDTLLTIYSDKLQHEIIKLEAELANAISELKVYETGEKPQLIEAARNKILL